MLNMIRDYPVRHQDYRDLHEQTITASASGMPGSAGTHRPLEQLAMMTLPPQEQREYDAVRKAIERTKLMPNAQERLDVIKLTMWRSRNTLYQAAAVLHLSERTARRYRNQFLLLVGLSYGFLTEDEYMAAVKTDLGKKRTPIAKQM